MEKRKLKKKGIALNGKPGIVRNSIVTDPAIGVGFHCFSTLEEKLANSKLLFKSSEEKQILAGPVLIPNIPILRKDAKTGEYFEMIFTKEDIIQLNRLRQFHRLINSFTLEHNSNKVLDKNSIIDEQNWIIIDPNHDTANKYGFDNLPEGTLFNVSYVQNKDLFYEIINNYNGFSVEAYFDFIDFEEKLNLKNIIKMEKNIFTKISEFLKFSKEEEKAEKFEMYSFKMKTGEEVIIDSDTMEVTINGEIPADGDYELEDGTMITVASGLLVDVKQPQMQASVEEDKKNQEQEQEFSKVKDELLQLTTQFETFKQENANLKTEIENLKADFEKEKAELVHQIELYKKMKRAVEKPDVKVETSTEKQTNKFASYVDKLEKIQNHIN